MEEIVADLAYTILTVSRNYPFLFKQKTALVSTVGTNDVGVTLCSDLQGLLQQGSYVQEKSRKTCVFFYIDNHLQ